MTNIKKIFLGVLTAVALAGSAHAAAPAPTPAPLSRAEMNSVRGETFISYGALGKNGTSCSRTNANYYNCRPGGQANPYNRGCSAASHCSRP